MSWDVMVFNSVGTPVDLAGAPPDWRPEPMGEAEVVRQLASRAIEGIDWTDPAWGVLDQESLSIEFSLQAHGLVEAMTLHVRGEGNPFPLITALCLANSWVALDHTTGEFLDPSQPSDAGWKQWKRFRDRSVIQS